MDWILHRCGRNYDMDYSDNVKQLKNPHTQHPQVNLTGVMNVSRWTMGGFVTENNTTMK